MNRPPIALLPPVLLLIAGCTTDARREGPPPSERDAATTRATANERPEPPRTVDGLTLEQALALARTHHPDLAAYTARREEAEARAEQAGLFPNPEAFLRMEAAPFSGGTTDDADYLVGATFSLPTGGRLAAARRVEELESEGIAAESLARRFEIESAVRIAFAGAALDQAEMKVRQEAVGAALRSVELARVRLEAGDALPQTIDRAQIEAIRAEAGLVGARGDLREAFVELATRIGLPDLTVEGLAGEGADESPLPALETLLGGLDRHPRLVRANLRLQVAEARLDLALARRYPDIDLEFGYRHIGDDDEEAFDLGLAIPLPILDRNQGAIRAARSAIRAAQADGAAVTARLHAELVRNHTRLEAAAQRLHAIRGDLFPRARAILAAEEARYQAGDLTLAEILPLRRDIIDIRLEELAARRAAFEAQVRLAPFLEAGRTP